MSLRVLSIYEGFFAGGARVLHTDVIAGLHAGGQSHAVLSLSSTARRDSAVQSLHDDARYRRLADAGVEVTALSGVAGAEPMHPSAFGELDLHRAAEAIAQADVVLTLKEQPLGLLLALRAHGLMPPVPVAACLHRSDPAHSGPALGWLREAAETGMLSAMISCAHSTDEAYARHLPLGLDRRVVPNGVDTEAFAPTPTGAVDGAALRASLGIPVDAPVVLLAARFDEMKDPALFLRAAARHALARPDAHYLLCGSGMTSGNPAFTAMVTDAGLPGERLHALGLRGDMPALYRIADIVALTSAFGEASPLCLLEGAASGATPVTTDVGDAARRVEGFGLVTSRDPDAIAAAWQRVLDDRAHWRAAALAARAGLSRDRMVGEYRFAIESLALRRRIAA